MILASIKPYYYYLIAEEKKKIEVRKMALKNLPQDIAFYMSKDEKSFAKIPKEFQEKYRKHFGKVGLAIVCNKITRYNCDKIFDEYFIAGYIGAYMPLKEMCLTNKDLIEYGKGRPLYGWHISDLKIYDKPKELSEFRAYNFKSMNGTDVCGNYDCKYYQDSGSYMIPPSCAKNGCRITRPPQSYMFVEEVQNDN